MSSLSDELLTRSADIVQRWYEAWKRTEHPHPEVGEAALKDSLGAQLELIGEELRDLARAEVPEAIWQVPERLDPEKRVSQEIPIEEVVQEYRLAVETVRGWIRERGIEVPFKEFSYFYEAMFELTAESARRYSRYQREVITRDRARYLAGVMHQLRTPLSALAIGVETLGRLDRAPESLTVERLRRNVRRIRFLVEGVLRLERFRPWELPVRPEEIRPARVIEELMSDLERDASAKGLRFEAHVNRSLRMSVDPDLFSDALGNLMQNAIKFTAGGFVIVEAEECGDEVVFRVHDSGVGIAEERRQGLLREVQPGSEGGVGLGLRIARNAAEAMGGELGYESAVGRGSVFWVRLPCAAAAREEARPEITPEA